MMETNFRGGRGSTVARHAGIHVIAVLCMPLAVGCAITATNTTEVLSSKVVEVRKTDAAREEFGPAVVSATLETDELLLSVTRERTCPDGYLTTYTEVDVRERKANGKFAFLPILGWGAGVALGMLIDYQTVGADERRDYEPSLAPPAVWGTGLGGAGAAVVGGLFATIDSRGEPRTRTGMKKPESESCGSEPMAAQTVVVAASGSELSCETDEEGACRIPVSEEDRFALCGKGRVRYSTKVGDRGYSGFIVDGIRGSEACEKVAEQLAQRRQDQEKEQVREAYLHAADRLIALCSEKQVAPADVVAVVGKLSEASREVVRLRAVIPSLSEKEGEVKGTCAGHVRAIVKDGDAALRKEDVRAALPYYSAAYYFAKGDPGVKGKLDGVIARLRQAAPARIRDIAALPEGDGVVMYYSLVNSDDVFTVADGKVDVVIALASHGSPFDRCFEATYDVSESDFAVATLGLGAFEREAVIHKLPFVRWSEMKCAFVVDVVRSMGHQALRRMWNPSLDLVLKIRFRTVDGEVVEAADTFYPW